MLWAMVMALGLQQQPAFVVANETAIARDEIVRVSMPLPKNMRRTLHCALVEGQRVPAVPLLHWPDGSLALVQLHVPLQLAPRQRRRIQVDLTDEPPTARSQAFPLQQPQLPLFCELEDPFGQIYVARFEPDKAAGPGGVCVESSLLRVQRFVSRHRQVGAPERQFLGLVAWLTTFAGRPHAELTLLLDNGAHHHGIDLGTVRFKRFSICSSSTELQVAPRFAKENQLGAPSARTDGGWRLDLLGPSSILYLGDRTAKAFRLDLFLPNETTQSQRDTHRAIATAPLRALPDLEWTRSTRAYGAHGGPAGLLEIEGAGSVPLRLAADFGPFGSYGDSKDAAANGTPRNGPCVLHNVVRWGSAAMLADADRVFLQQTLRPTAGVAPRLPADMEAFRQRMTMRHHRRPHGFTAPDYEHFTADLVYEFFWLTGDPLARAELLRLGQGLRSVLADLPFVTCRGEGWCLQAAALCARVEPDRSLLTMVHRRFTGKVQPLLGDERAPFVLRQPGHPDAFGGGVTFDAPWQMAALVYGANAMQRCAGWLDAEAASFYAQMAVATAQKMATSGWIDDEGPKYFVAADDPTRFERPIGFSLLEGTAMFQSSAFTLASDLTADDRQQALFRRRAGTLLAARGDLRLARADRWLQFCFPASTGR